MKQIKFSKLGALCAERKLIEPLGALLCLIFVALGCNLKTDDPPPPPPPIVERPNAPVNQNLAEKIVGTWSAAGGGTFTFTEDGEMTMSGRPGVIHDYTIVDNRTVEISPQTNKAGKRPVGKMIVTIDDRDEMQMRLIFGSSPESVLRLKRAAETTRRSKQNPTGDKQ